MSSSALTEELMAGSVAALCKTLVGGAAGAGGGSGTWLAGATSGSGLAVFLSHPLVLATCVVLVVTH